MVGLLGKRSPTETCIQPKSFLKVQESQSTRTQMDLISWNCAAGTADRDRQTATLSQTPNSKTQNCNIAENPAAAYQHAPPVLGKCIFAVSIHSEAPHKLR